MRTVFSLLLTAGLLAAYDGLKAPEPGKANPDTTPLEVTIEGTAKYPLDLGGKTADEFEASLKEEKVPAPPRVELKLVIKNTSKEDIQVWTSGDPVTVDLTLTGKGAAKVAPKFATTNEFRLPKAVTVEAGKTVEMPLTSLACGFRNIGQFHYWTKPGEYELVATLNTGVSPAPKGSIDGGKGFGQVRVASKPLKITIEEKK